MQIVLCARYRDIQQGGFLRHTVFHHRYHIVWITKYLDKVLDGALQGRREARCRPATLRTSRSSDA